MLVPLTASLYAAGTLTNPESILVDVGTGYYIEVKEQCTNVPRHWQ
jgi:prefoldin alpha subunit